MNGAIRSMTLTPVSKTCDFSRLLGERRGWAVNRILDLGAHRSSVIDRLTNDVEDAAQRCRSDRHPNRLTRIDRLGATAQAVGRGHRHGTDPVVAKVLLNFENQRVSGALSLDRQSVVDFGQPVGWKLNVDDHALNLNDATSCHLDCFLSISRRPDETRLTRHHDSAAAPAAISETSRVICAWRALL